MTSDQARMTFGRIRMPFLRRSAQLSLSSICCNRMFLVFDGNHHLYLWMLVAKQHLDVERVHLLVIARFLKAKRESMIEIELAMHELNK